MAGSFHPRADPAGVGAERRLDSAVIASLRERIHDVTLSPPWSLGRTRAAGRDPDTGLLSAAADPRGMQGYACGRRPLPGAAVAVAVAVAVTVTVTRCGLPGSSVAGGACQAEGVSALERLGLGLAALGRPAYINVGGESELPAARTVEAMRAACWDVLDAAYAAGIRRVDTARSYGRAEEFLAGWLAERGHRDVTVSSKWGYAYVAGWRRDAEVHEVKAHTLERYRTQLGQTRRLLGGRLALYQVHSLTPDSPLFADAALRHAIAETAAGGLRAGFSTSGPGQADTVRRAFDLEVAGQRLFTAVQSTWNPLETSVGAALREAHHAGAHVTVKEAMANGRLAISPPAELSRLAAEHRAGPDALALAAVLAQPWADTVLLGAVSVAQLRANLAATAVPLDAAGLRRLAGLAMPAAEYWSSRAALPWN